MYTINYYQKYIQGIRRYDDDIYDLTIVMVYGPNITHNVVLKRALRYEEMVDKLMDRFTSHKHATFEIYQSTLYTSDVVLVIKEV